MGLATPFGVDTVRNLLVNTGSPQQAGTYPVTEKIGPRPDLGAALAEIATNVCDDYKASKPDYAPMGLPDFDQRQIHWYIPDGRWTHDGPVALANCLWWLDSKFETNTTPPPAIIDNYDLVEAYGAWDDHSSSNVQPLVDSLGLYCGTNMALEGPGTALSMMLAGIGGWLAKTGTASDLVFEAYPLLEWDSLYAVRDHIKAGNNVIVLLGFYHYLGDSDWGRIGGHYVTMAGTCEATASFCVSDPWMDVREGEPPAVPGTHPSTDHNDAANVSGPHGTMDHDRYDLSWGFGPGQPYPFGLTGYPMDWPDVLNFQDMNPGDPPVTPHPFMGQPVYTIMEWAIVIKPLITSCCGQYTGGFTGNTNCSTDGLITLNDITMLIDRVYLTKTPLCCEENGNTNGSLDGLMTLNDITVLIDHVYITKGPTAACPSSGGPVSYSANVHPIIIGRCAIPGCHSGGSTSGGLDLGSGDYGVVRVAAGNNGPIITEGDASVSTLYTKTTSSPPFGNQMPYMQTPLTVQEQEMIRDWINQGAQDN
jgi:hypothetical protein